MPSTMNITRSTRRENEAGLSGSEAVSVENVGIPDQVISAGAEEQTALGAFKDHQLQTLCLLCDQAVEAQFLGVRYAILATTVGPPGTITHTGDLLQEIFPGDLVRLEGTAASDGVYLVQALALLAGDTTITLDNGQLVPAVGGPVGTVARVASAQRTGYAYSVLATVVGTGAITYTGNVSDKFAAGEALIIAGTVGCDGYWRIDSVTYLAGVTTIVVLDEMGAIGLPAAAGAVGYFQKMEPAFNLAANVPMMWSIGTGLDNPFLSPDTDSFSGPIFNAFRGDVAYCMVNNPGVVNANFAGRIGTNAII